jgi:prevent-host-death family protein
MAAKIILTPVRGSYYTQASMYTIHQAKTNFSKLLRKAARGEEVIIARGKTPVVKLVAVPPPRANNKKNTKKRVPGRWKGKISYAPDAFAPLTKEELTECGIQ